jgi:hypothetical protein
MQRRTFLAGPAAALAAGVSGGSEQVRANVDFRYSPKSWQATFCFPDDPNKSLVGEKGDLRYGYDRHSRINYFPNVVQFSLAGMDREPETEQRLEAPGVPIVHTRVGRSEAFLELITFATNRAGEGRVDNVILLVRPRSKRMVHAAPVVFLKTRRTAVVKNAGASASVFLEGQPEVPFLLADCTLRSADTGDGYRFTAPEGSAAPQRLLRYFFRFPLEGQDASRIAAGLAAPEALLAEARAYWSAWSPFRDVVWRLPAVYQNFLLACGRNILQARENVDGRLTFQVGATTYRGLWVVDGHFILEAARYLGYTDEVQQGLEATWAMQGDDGGIFAGGGKEHWKDTGIAMFTLARQAELAQNWGYFKRMQPQVLAGVRFLQEVRERGRKEGSANGRYGLLARGFGDGGIGGGVRDEFTNSLWSAAGLTAVAEAARRQQLSGFEAAQQLSDSLRAACMAAARQQMRRHAAGFDFLPMLLKEDSGWAEADERRRPRPQTGQWALAHCIYPGLLFSPDDPVVQGYMKLMQACIQEDVPVETGWLPHEGIWNYDAAFAAHAFLWAGARDSAMALFHGFLNHAAPLWCWREEQPLQGAMIGSYVGDMPHNWASAECILFLRHMLALEDGRALRLLAGIGTPELAMGEPYEIEGSPTRFGRVSISLLPGTGRRGWSLKFRREGGDSPQALRLPALLGSGLELRQVAGAKFNRSGDAAEVDPAARNWEASWSG